MSMNDVTGDNVIALVGTLNQHSSVNKPSYAGSRGRIK